MFRQPEPKQNSKTKVDVSFRQPVFCQTNVGCRYILSNIKSPNQFTIILVISQVDNGIQYRVHLTRVYTLICNQTLKLHFQK